MLPFGTSPSLTLEHPVCYPLDISFGILRTSCSLPFKHLVRYPSNIAFATLGILPLQHLLLYPWSIPFATFETSRSVSVEHHLRYPWNISCATLGSIPHSRRAGGPTEKAGGNRQWPGGWHIIIRRPQGVGFNHSKKGHKEVAYIFWHGSTPKSDTASTWNFY